MGLTTLFDGCVPAVGPRPEVRTAGLERSWLSNPAEWLVAMFGGGTSSSGITVTPAVAVESTAFWAGVRVVAEDLGSLPFILYRRIGARGKERDPEHYLYPLLHDAPNPETDAMAFVETVTAWAASRGVGYAEVVRRGDGTIEALWQIDPQRVQPLRLSVAGSSPELVFRVQLPAGQRTADGADYVLLDRDRMFRLNGLSLDGVSGASPVTLHAEAIGLTIALERHGARFFANGAIPGGVLEHPSRIGDDAYNRLVAAWENRHKGLNSAHRLAILEDNMKYHETGAQNDKAQFLESRKFQVREVARILRVKPHKIGDLEDATFSNIEHESIDHVVSTVRPWAVRWERAVALQLLVPEERKTHFAEFLLDALLRGDSFSRAQTLAIKRQNGIISADEWRELDNENPLPDGLGKVYLCNAAMVPVKQLLQPPAAPAPPGEPGPSPAEDQGADLRLRVDAAGILVRAGYLPDDAARVAGLPPMGHLGLPPVTVQSAAVLDEDAPPKGAPPGQGATPPEGEDDGDQAEDQAEEPPARALLPLFELDLGRAARRHGKALVAAARKQDLRGLEAWATAYFAAEAKQVEESLLPLVRATVLVAGASDAAVQEHTAAAARRLCRLRLEQVGDAVRAKPADLAGAAETVVQAWEKGVGQVAAAEHEAAMRFARDRAA